MKYFIQILLLLFFYCYSAEAASLAILPVLSERIEAHQIKTGPKLFLSQEKNNWELARLIHSLLSVGGIYSLKKMDTIQRVYKTLHLNSKQNLRDNTLADIGAELNAEKLLVSFLQKMNNQYILTTKIFYTKSRYRTDTIQTSSPDIWRLIDEHLRKRFPAYNIKSMVATKKSQTVLFLLDTSGSNYKEIKALKRFIHQRQKFNIGVCALAGNGQISFLRVGIDKRSVINFFSQIFPRGGSQNLINFFGALNCLKKIFPRNNNLKQVKIIILVSAVPKDVLERRRIKLILRKFSQKAKIICVGTSNLSPSHRNFWKETIAELSHNKNHQYRDLLYRQKFGLSNGDEIYVVKQGKQLLQSTSKDILSQPNSIINVPKRYWSYLRSNNIKYLYEQLSNNKVIASQKIEILMEKTILPHPIDSVVKQYKHQQNYIKVLVEMETAKFWLSLPKKTIYTNQGLMKIKRGESYYFMLNMQSGSQGIPFKNQPNFGAIYHNLSNLPRILVLSLTEYLKNQSRYLGYSIGASSLYIFFAKVKIIKLSNLK